MIVKKILMMFQKLRYDKIKIFGSMTFLLIFLFFVCLFVQELMREEEDFEDRDEDGDEVPPEYENDKNM